MSSQTLLQLYKWYDYYDCFRACFTALGELSNKLTTVDWNSIAGYSTVGILLDIAKRVFNKNITSFLNEAYLEFLKEYVKDLFIHIENKYVKDTLQLKEDIE